MHNSSSRDDDGVGEAVLPLAEERAVVGKRAVRTGKVRIATVTDTVEETVRAILEDEAVEVTRVTVGREVERAPEVRSEDGVTIIPVLEEIVVVEKRLLLKEEIHVRRRIGTEAVEVPVTLRKQRAVVERLDEQPGNHTNKE
jgi:uncharacterized protein (TIGR02271 family)